ncbi:MAG: CPBP family intramembrane metalloprotease [Planctomycetia bacterium]|nr:CPBP family intramembrane metalloprotease [Planctomycetia bacterium]
MRFVIDPDWWKVPFGTLTPLSVAAGTLLPVAVHPAEMLAAAVWFTSVTWLMFKTKNIWDCIVAHAVTNLLLGIWVVTSGEWHFL